jgi:predicted dehydrogenase
MDSSILNIGLVGAGSNTKLRHIPGFESQQQVFIQSVSNRSIESGQRVAKEYGIEVVHENWVELVEDPNNDAICIGTWPYMHCSMVLAALESGKHVMTEARMATSAAEAHIMLEASKNYPELVTQIVPAPHTLNLDKTIIKMISEGYLGKIISIDASITQGGFVDTTKPFHWRQSRDISGHNIMGLGIWYEAIMRWVGPASSVQSLTRITVPTRLDEDGNTHFLTIPDHVEILCELFSGPTMHIRFSDVLGHAPGDSIWIYGTEGTLRIDGTNRKIYAGRHSDSNMNEVFIESHLQGDWRVEEEFINAIRGVEKITHTTFEDGVRYMEFSEAVTRSSQSGEKIYLPF